MVCPNEKSRLFRRLQATIRPFPRAGGCKECRIAGFTDEFHGLAVFLILIPVLLKESLNFPAPVIIQAVGTGIQLLFHETATLYYTAGSADLPFAFTIPQLAALACIVRQGRARTAIGPAAADQENLRCEGVIRICHVRRNVLSGSMYFVV